MSPEKTNGKLNHKTKMLDVTRYEVINEMSLSERCAHFLDWCAREYPYQFIAYNVLVRAIMGFARTPRMDSQQVEQIRAKLSSGVRAVLISKYGRDKVSELGIGVRATVDSADALTTAMPRRVRHFESAKTSLARTNSIIDASKIVRTPELKPYLDWLNRGVRPALALVNSAEFEAKMLPPIREVEHDGADDEVVD